MADELDLPKALGFARRLKSIPSFPWDDDVILSHAQHLMRWCRGAMVDGHSIWPADAQAEWLVTAAQESWDKWMGTAELRKLFRTKFVPEVPAANEYLDRGLKPPTECRSCNDSGIVGEQPGKKEYCDCSFGETLRIDPNLGDRWLELINGTRRIMKAETATPFDQQEKTFQESQSRIQLHLAEAAATLEDPNTTREQKEIAQEVVKLYTYKRPKKVRKLK